MIGVGVVAHEPEEPGSRVAGRGPDGRPDHDDGQRRDQCPDADLAQADADVYAESLVALAARKEGSDDERRDFALGTALDEAAQAPLMIAESAADVALLAATAATIVKPEVQADARAAAALAAGAAAAAALLVDVNLASTPSDARVRRARAAAERAETAARGAVEGDSLQSAT
jgi:formiminotetrahydrofolate cyclodeaminase